jgi:hypothetical protein
MARYNYVIGSSKLPCMYFQVHFLKSKKYHEECCLRGCGAVCFVRTGVSEEVIAYIFRVEKIRERRKALAVV